MINRKLFIVSWGMPSQASSNDDEDQISHYIFWINYAI